MSTLSSRIAAFGGAVLRRSALWWTLGVLNLGAGVFIATRSAQSQDLRSVVGWSRLWLAEGVAPYVDPSSNYPPYALVFLSPLTSFPSAWLPGIWAAINLALTVVVGLLGLRWARRALSHPHGEVLPAALLLSWESLRIVFGNGQFTLLVVACGVGALLLAMSEGITRRIGSGVLLGVAMIKPQIAIAFALWLVLGLHVVPLLAAAGTMLLGLSVYALRLGQTPLQSAQAYLAILGRELFGPAPRIGDLDLRELFRALLPAPAANVSHTVFVIATLVGIAVASRSMRPRERILVLLPLTTSWSLMSVYHNIYDLVMIWPSIAAVSVWQLSERGRALRVAALAALQGALVIDIPGLAWKLNGRGPLPSENLLQTLVAHFDRLLILAAFACTVSVWRRWAQTATAPGAVS